MVALRNFANSFASFVSLKYEFELRQIPGCPSSDYVPRQRDAFRYVKEAVVTSEDFIPRYLLPVRRVVGDESLKCKEKGLSFYDTEVQARTKYQLLSKNFKNISKTLGQFLAYGILHEHDGISCPSQADGHFTFHEAAAAVLPPKFAIVGSLP